MTAPGGYSLALMRAVEQPVTPAGRELRKEVEAAVVRGSVGVLREALARAVTLRPSERMAAVHAPIIAGMGSLQAGGALDRVQDALVEALGEDVLQGVLGALVARATPPAAVEG